MPRKVEEFLNEINELFRDGYDYLEIHRFLVRYCKADLSIRTLQRILRDHGMYRKNVTESSLKSIVLAIEMELESSGKNLGYKMWLRLRYEYQLKVKQSTVLELLRLLDPAGVKRRCRYCLKRRVYRVPGPNFILDIDGMDKLNPFGFAIHGAIHGYSKKTMWLEVSTSNKNPKIIAHYFLSTVLKFKRLPCLVRSDAGTENNIVETLQIALRYSQNDEFAGENSFLRGKSVHNQRIEAFWSKL